MTESRDHYVLSHAGMSLRVLDVDFRTLASHFEPAEWQRVVDAREPVRLTLQPRLRSRLSRQPTQRTRPTLTRLASKDVPSGRAEDTLAPLQGTDSRALYQRSRRSSLSKLKRPSQLSILTVRLCLLAFAYAQVATHLARLPAPAHSASAGLVD